jgi:hypothetical protein
MSKIIRIKRCKDCHPYCRSIEGAFVCVHPKFREEGAFVLLGNIEAGVPSECPLEDLPPSQLDAEADYSGTELPNLNVCAHGIAWDRQCSQCGR